MCSNNKVIYQHLKPCGEVFYIGIGNPSRAYHKTGRSKWWEKVIKKYPNYEVQILKKGLPIEEAIELEIILIAHFGRKDLGLGTLVNMTDGGEGVVGISESNKLYGVKNPMFGKKWDSEYLKIFSEKSSGSNNTMFGVDWRDSASEETIANWKTNIGKANLGSKRTDETKSKMSIEVHQYTKSKQYVNSYFGTREAGRQTGILASSISANCLGKRKSAGGYIWSYIKY